MRMLVVKRIVFLFALLLGYSVVNAADDDLITKQIIIKLDEAGTLPNRIASSKMYKITNLKIVGEINGTDLRFIRDMAGRSVKGDNTNGKLSVLDLSEAKIVKGGNYYYTGSVRYSNWSMTYYTSNDCLGSAAFYGCSGLASVTIPSSVTLLGDGVFCGCGGLASLVIPSSVTSIGDYAFYGCSGLASLVIPSSVTSIGDNAFYGCSGLTSLTIPYSVTSIGSRAFSGCRGLTNLTISSSVTSMERDTFESCCGLKNVHYQIEDDIETYLSKNHPYIDVECGIEYYLNNTKITSVMIPSTITELGKNIFHRCKGLTSVYVGWSVPISTYTAFKDADVSNCTLYVPQGTYQDYWLTDVWGDFGNILEYDMTGVKKLTTSIDAKEVFRYSVNGQRLSAPTKGMNIVKYSDGSVKKVAVQ